MNSRKLFFVLLGGMALLAIIGIAGVVFGNNMLQKKAADLTALKLESRTLDEQQRSLVQAKRDIQQYAELESIAKSVVPQEKDQARTVREIVGLAEQNGIAISSITFPASNLGQTPARPAQPQAEQGENGSSPAPSAQRTAPTTQVKPVEGIQGVYELEINAQSDSAKPVPYSQLLAFLAALEQNRRTAQVSSLSIQPTSEDRNRVTFSLVIKVYLKP